MKILHLLSNWKWTERSEPVVDLALSQMNLGAKICLVCEKAPADTPVTDVSYNAKEKGLENVIALPEMSKHLKIFSVLPGIRKLREIIEAENPHIIHCHMHNAHFLAGLANKKDNNFLLVRSIYNPELLAQDLRSRFCNKHFTHGLIVMTEKVKQSAVQQSFSTEKIEVIEPGIDVERFSPNRSLDQDLCSIDSLEGYFVMGMVTRIRQARRLDISLQLIKQLHFQYPQLRLLLAGRGRPGAFESVVDRPASEMGIRNYIFPIGYCEGDQLVAAYRKMDVLVYPMPGTDQTCRTVREAMAAGVPVVAPRLGYLTDLIQNGENGYLVDFSAENFARAIKKLIDSKDKLKKLSQGALESAQNRFSLNQQAKKTLYFYQRLRRNYSSEVK